MTLEGAVICVRKKFLIVLVLHFTSKDKLSV